jgi:hypothetical protein
MTSDERETLARRLAEIRQQLDAIGSGNADGSRNATHSKHLYAEMVSLERRLFATNRTG